VQEPTDHSDMQTDLMKWRMYCEMAYFRTILYIVTPPLVHASTLKNAESVLLCTALWDL